MEVKVLLISASAHAVTILKPGWLAGSGKTITTG